MESTAELPEPSLERYDVRDPENNVHMVVSAGGSFLQHHAEKSRTEERVCSLDCVCMIDVYHQTFCDWADLVLPACSHFESEEGIVNIRGQRKRVILSGRAIEPLFESRTDFWIVREIFKRMGAVEKCTLCREATDRGTCPCVFTVVRHMHACGVIWTIRIPRYRDLCRRATPFTSWRKMEPSRRSST